MAEHKLYRNVYDELESRRPAPIVKRQPPPPGQKLRAAVNAALNSMQTTPDADPVTLRQVDDLLVGGLAWAAATGDTCRIEPAVRAVRVARTRLDTADTDGAKNALLAALDGFVHPEPNRDSR